MDAAVLAAYGWNDVATTCGFGLDYLDLDDDIELPSDLQDASTAAISSLIRLPEAAAFDSQIPRCSKQQKETAVALPLARSVRDDVLARLLALNAERAAEEAALGLKPVRSHQAKARAALKKQQLLAHPMANKSASAFSY